jgi:hypothetical protein
MYSVLNATFRLVFLNNFVINFVYCPTYVNVAHFVFDFVCVFIFSFSVCTCVFAFIVEMTLSNTFASYLLLRNICFIVLYSFFLFMS